MLALVSLTHKPILELLVEMGPVFKGAIAHEEVLLEGADHALVLALGARTVRLAGPWGEAVVAGEVEKALVELHRTVRRVAEHRSLLIVAEHLLGDAAEAGAAANPPLVGVLGVLAVGGPGVKAAGESELVDDEVDGGGLAGDGGLDLAPVTLELLAGVGFEADGGTAGAQGTLGGNVVAQDGDAAVVALAFALAEDDNGIPDAVLEQTVDGGLEGGDLAATRRALGSGSGAALEGAADGPGMDAEFGSDVFLIDTAIGECFNDHEVLLLEYRTPPSLVRVGDILRDERRTS